MVRISFGAVSIPGWGRARQVSYHGHGTGQAETNQSPHPRHEPERGTSRPAAGAGCVAKGFAPSAANRDVPRSEMQEVDALPTCN